MTNNSPGVPEKDDLENRVRALQPLDLLAELVETRYRERQKTTMRWWTVTTISIASLAVALIETTGFLANKQEHMDTVKSIATLSVRPGLSGPTPSVVSPDPDPEAVQPEPTTPEETTVSSPYSTLTLNSLSALTLIPNTSWRYRIDVPQGRYVIDADAAGDIDPIIELYRVDGTQLDLIAVNDDGGDGLDSRIVIDLLEDTVYELVVREVYGRPGSMGVTLRDFSE